MSFRSTSAVLRLFFVALGLVALRFEYGSSCAQAQRLLRANVEALAHKLVIPLVNEEYSLIDGLLSRFLGRPGVAFLLG